MIKITSWAEGKTISGRAVRGEVEITTVEVNENIDELYAAVENLISGEAGNSGVVRVTRAHDDGSYHTIYMANGYRDPFDKTVKGAGLWKHNIMKCFTHDELFNMMVGYENLIRDIKKEMNTRV